MNDVCTVDTITSSVHDPVLPKPTSHLTETSRAPSIPRTGWHNFPGHSYPAAGLLLNARAPIERRRWLMMDENKAFPKANCSMPHGFTPLHLRHCFQRGVSVQPGVVFSACGVGSAAYTTASPKAHRGTRRSSNFSAVRNNPDEIQSLALMSSPYPPHTRHRAIPTPALPAVTSPRPRRPCPRPPTQPCYGHAVDVSRASAVLLLVPQPLSYSSSKCWRRARTVLPMVTPTSTVRSLPRPLALTLVPPSVKACHVPWVSGLIPSLPACPQNVPWGVYVPSRDKALYECLSPLPAERQTP